MTGDESMATFPSSSDETGIHRRLYTAAKIYTSMHNLMQFFPFHFAPYIVTIVTLHCMSHCESLTGHHVDR